MKPMLIYKFIPLHKLEKANKEINYVRFYLRKLEQLKFRQAGGKKTIKTRTEISEIVNKKKYRKQQSQSLIP